MARQHPGEVIGSNFMKKIM